MAKKYLLGYDIGSSSVKASLIDAESGKLLASAFSPKEEMDINSPVQGWAEQQPEDWWKHVVIATQELISKLSFNPADIEGIGISYQMHGLVIVDKDLNVLRPSIIWCDSRAVELGDKAFDRLGSEYCLGNLLNSPGNFTASKLKWVKENEPETYNKIYKIMLPGDYIAAKITSDILTTVSGLSEGIFWDFERKEVSKELLEYYELDKSLLPQVVPTFSNQGTMTADAAAQLGLKEGIPVGYRAGDQPNNAFSLNVLNPREIAATAGTSGVIYGITDKNTFDEQSRVNTFAHVNYTNDSPLLGVLLCINGTGILNSWMRNKLFGGRFSYEEMNQLASESPIGSEGLITIPFGNGAERVLANKEINASFHGYNFNTHTIGHMLRSAQEGIVHSFNYGLNIMKDMGVDVEVVRAGNANMFLSSVFCESLANTCNIEIELYNTDGSIGAARGAGMGTGYYSDAKEAFGGLNIIKNYKPEPDKIAYYRDVYNNWLNHLNQILQK